MGFVKQVFNKVTDDILGINPPARPEAPTIRQDKKKDISEGVKEAKKSQRKRYTKKGRRGTVQTGAYGLEDDALKIGLRRTIGVK